MASSSANNSRNLSCTHPLSRAVHISGLEAKTQLRELVALGHAFGRIESIAMHRGRGGGGWGEENVSYKSSHAFINFVDSHAADTLIRRVKIHGGGLLLRGRLLAIQTAASLPISAALRRKMLGGASRTLQVTIAPQPTSIAKEKTGGRVLSGNPPLSVEGLTKWFSRHGDIVDVILHNSKDAVVEMASIQSAVRARRALREERRKAAEKQAHWRVAYLPERCPGSSRSLDVIFAEIDAAEATVVDASMPSTIPTASPLPPPPPPNVASAPLGPSESGSQGTSKAERGINESRMAAAVEGPSPGRTDLNKQSRTAAGCDVKTMTKKRQRGPDISGHDASSRESNLYAKRRNEEESRTTEEKMENDDDSSQEDALPEWLLTTEASLLWGERSPATKGIAAAPTKRPPPCRSEQALPPSRHLLLFGIPTDISEHDLCVASNRFGRLEEVEIDEESRRGMIAMIDKEAAAQMMLLVTQGKLYIHHHRITRVYYLRKERDDTEVLWHWLKAGATRNLYVGNIGKDFGEKVLHELFSPFGNFDSIIALPSKKIAFVNMTSRGTHPESGILYWNSIQAAVTARSALNGVELRGSRLVVNYAKEKIGQFAVGPSSTLKTSKAKRHQQ
eukprot:jgi/Bigna1/75445/fgenesh1_pg.34_\